MENIHNQTKDKISDIMFIISKMNTIMKILDEFIYEKDTYYKTDIENIIDILKENFNNLRSEFIKLEQNFEMN